MKTKMILEALKLLIVMRDCATTADQDRNIEARIKRICDRYNVKRTTTSTFGMK